MLKLSSFLLAVVVFITSASIFSVSAESTYNFTLSNLNGKKKASADSFQTAYELFLSTTMMQAFTYLYVNKNCEISADELADYAMMVDIRSSDSELKDLSFASQNSIHIPYAFSMTNISANFNSKITFLSLSLKRCVLDNIPDCSTVINVLSDCTLKIHKDTVLSGEIIIKNDSVLTLEIDEDCELALNKLTINKGSILISGDCLKNGQTPIKTSADLMFFSAEGFKIVNEDGFLVIIDENRHESDGSSEENSTPDSGGDSSTDDSSTPDDSGENSSPDENSTPDSGENSSADESSAPDSGDDSTAEENSTPDDSGGDSSTDDSSAPDSGGDSSADESSAPDSGGDSSADESSTPDDSGGDSTSDESSTPDSGGDSSADESSAPDSGEDSTADDSSAPDSGENSSADESSAPDSGGSVTYNPPAANYSTDSPSKASAVPSSSIDNQPQTENITPPEIPLADTDNPATGITYCFSLMLLLSVATLVVLRK